MPATQIRDGAAAQVHVRLRLRQEHPAPPDRSTADGGPPVLLIHGDAQTPAHPVDDLPPHVVAGVAVTTGRGALTGQKGDYLWEGSRRRTPDRPAPPPGGGPGPTPAPRRT